MAEINLTQPEADALLAMEKHRLDDAVHDFPSLGGALTISLQSLDRREQFLLDIRQGLVDLLKGTYQNRARGVVVLPIAILTTREYPVRIFMFTGKGLVISGRFRYLRIDLTIPVIIVILSSHRSFREDYSHDRRNQ